MDTKTLRWLCCLLAIGLFCLPGCGKEDESIKVYRLAKDTAQGPGDGLPAGHPGVGGDMGGNVGDAAAAANDAPTWVLPKDWTAGTPGDPRIVIATYNATAGSDPAVVTVSHAVWDVVGNVNRWRGQVHLPKASDEEVAKLVQHFEVPGGSIAMVDLTGPADAQGESQRIMVAIYPNAGVDWFFKITGAAAKVATQQANFEAFVRSVQFASDQAGAAASGAMPSMPADSAAAPTPPVAPSKPMEYTLPPNWKAQPVASQSSMPGLEHVAGFEVGQADDKVEVAVTKIFGSFGSQEANLQMWRSQVGLPVAADAKGVEKRDVSIGGVGSKWIDLTGPAVDGKKAQRLIVCIAEEGEGGSTWFFKMHGSAAAVAEQQAAFEAFLKSVKLPPIANVH